MSTAIVAVSVAFQGPVLACTSLACLANCLMMGTICVGAASLEASASSLPLTCRVHRIQFIVPAICFLNLSWPCEPHSIFGLAVDSHELYKTVILGSCCTVSMSRML